MTRLLVYCCLMCIVLLWQLLSRWTRLRLRVLHTVLHRLRGETALNISLFPVFHSFVFPSVLSHCSLNKQKRKTLTMVLNHFHSSLLSIADVHESNPSPLRPLPPDQASSGAGHCFVLSFSLEFLSFYA